MIRLSKNDRKTDVDLSGVASLLEFLRLEVIRQMEIGSERSVT